MDSDQNQLVSESSFSNPGWADLIWGSNEDDVHRAVSVPQHAQLDELNLQPNVQKNFEQKLLVNEPTSTFNVQNADPAFLTRFVMFASHVTFSNVWQFIQDFVEGHEQTNENYWCDEEGQAILGGLFEETRFVEYQIRMFTYGGELGLALEVLDGYPPAIQGFWKDLQRALKQGDFLQSSEQESDEEDFDEDDSFLFEDSDTEFDALDLNDAKFLKLSESPELARQWFQDLSNPNFMQQTLLLMTWNCQNQQNFETVTKDPKAAQKLFDTIIACMIATVDDFCLPIARCASKLVSQIVDSHDVRVTEKQFNVLVETLVRWTCEQNLEAKLTSSKEVASILSSQMSKMAPLAATCRETLERVYTQAPYDCVRENLHNVLRAH